MFVLRISSDHTEETGGVLVQALSSPTDTEHFKRVIQIVVDNLGYVLGDDLLHT